MTMTLKQACLICLVIAARQIAIASGIFGLDDRRPIYPDSPYAHLGQATAVGLLNSFPENMTESTFDITLDTLEPYLCPGERFRRDLSVNYACSGFLIAPDLLITAGHCSVNFGQVRGQTQRYCEAYQWMFNYQDQRGQQFSTKGISKDSLYSCKEIIVAFNQEKDPLRDFAIIRLDRPVAGITPLKLAQKEAREKESVFMIGYPMGTPMKLATNARVLKNNPQHQQFVTNLDAFEGNSGSPVFNSRKEVVGILVAGVPSQGTITDEKLGCSRYNVCSNDGLKCKWLDGDPKNFPDYQMAGAFVQKIQTLFPLLEKSGFKF